MRVGGLVCLLLGLWLFASPPAHAQSSQSDWAAQKRTVRIATGVQLKYVETGPRNGEPLILLHGLTDSSRSWSLAIPDLTERYRVVMPDQRGHGDSEKPACCYTVPALAKDAVALMDALGIRRAAVVGHSLGSLIAQKIAIDHPDRVSRLVLIGSAATGVGNETLQWLWDEVQKFSDPIDPQFLENWTSNPNPVDPEFLARVAQEAGSVPTHVWKAATRGLLEDDHTAQLRTIKAPTLVIWGDQDGVFPEADQQTLQQHLPGAEIKVYPGIGHNVQWEDPKAVAADIRAFVR